MGFFAFLLAVGVFYWGYWEEKHTWSLSQKDLTFKNHFWNFAPWVIFAGIIQFFITTTGFRTDTYETYAVAIQFAFILGILAQAGSYTIYYYRTVTDEPLPYKLNRKEQQQEYTRQKTEEQEPPPPPEPEPEPEPEPPPEPEIDHEAELNEILKTRERRP